MGGSEFCRGLVVGELQLREMGFDFVGAGPAQPVEAEHFVRPLRRLAAGPEGQHQADDDRAVGLDLDAVPVVAQQVAAAQQMLELSEEDLDGPTVGVHGIRTSCTCTTSTISAKVTAVDNN